MLDNETNDDRKVFLPRKGENFLQITCFAFLVRVSFHEKRISQRLFVSFRVSRRVTCIFTKITRYNDYNLDVTLYRIIDTFLISLPVRSFNTLLLRERGFNRASTYG